jgi:hypothetical protein
MTWTAFHRRGAILRAVTAAVEQRAADRAWGGTLPRTLADGTPLFPGVFRDELDLVGALLLRGHARLSGEIERELARQPVELERAVVRAWARAADDRPGLRLVIDRYTDDPVDERMAQVLRRAREKEWVRLAAAAGLASDEGPAAAAAGHRIELAARAHRQAPAWERLPAVPATRTCPGSLVQRIRAALAA